MSIKHTQKINSIAVLFLTILLFHSTVFPRTELKSKITGKIVDADSRTPSLNVNVFLANTTIGAASATDGSYIIEFVPPGIYDLVVSMIGYEVKTINIRVAYSQDYQFDIKLNSKPIQGDLIAVEAPRPKQWKRDLKKFKNLFSGYDLVKHWDWADERIADMLPLNYIADE